MQLQLQLQLQLVGNLGHQGHKSTSRTTRAAWMPLKRVRLLIQESSLAHSRGSSLAHSREVACSLKRVRLLTQGYWNRICSFGHKLHFWFVPPLVCMHGSDPKTPQTEGGEEQVLGLGTARVGPLDAWRSNSVVTLSTAMSSPLRC
jgi:hypothetical protein